MKLKYFPESVYIELFDSIDENLDYYNKNENIEWLEKKFNRRTFEKESRIDVPLPKLICSGEEKSTFEDYENSIRIHIALKDKITPQQASNPYLWAYLAHVEYWDYSCKRWANKRISEASIKDRFFCRSISGNRQGFLRNSISRLWWMAELTYQENKSNRYELTELLFSHSDLCQSIIERKFSMNKNVTVGILSAIKRINDDPDLKNVYKDENNEYEWRHLCKFINRYGAVTLLDMLSSEEICELSYNYVLSLRKK